MPTTETERGPDDDRPRGDSSERGLWLMVGALGLALAVWKMLEGPIPYDTSSYVAAAQTHWLAGLDPYGDALTRAPAYDGYVFVYPPHTLALLLPLAWLPIRAFVALDTLARLGAIAASLSWCVRRLCPSASTPLILVAALGCFAPLTFEFVNGNISIYLLSATLLFAHATRSAERARSAAVAALATLALSVKFTWLAPTMLLALARRSWAMLAASGAALLAVVAVNVWNLELATSWFERVGALREQMPDSALLDVSPLLALAVFACWMAMFVVGVRRRPDAPWWVFACTSLVWWPRLGLGLYVLMIPALLAIASRSKPAAIIALLVPNSLLCFYAIREGALVTYEHAMLAWACVVTCFVWGMFMYDTPPVSERP